MKKSKIDEVSSVLAPILFLVGAGAAILLVLFLFASLAWSQTQDGQDGSESDAAAWKKWEEAAAKVGAGESAPPMPDEEVTSHQHWCKNVSGWCPTVTNGVIAGTHWCLGKHGIDTKKKPKCYYSHRSRSYEIMLEWWDWLDEFMGGRHPLYEAGTIRTESEGVWSAMTKSTTKECGLASVDLAKAKLYDINACDAKANIWAVGQMANTRLMRLREKYPQVEFAPLSDQWKLAGACGAIGSNKVHALIDASGALRLDDDGALFYSHPHDRVLKWLMWADKSSKFDFYSYGGIAMLGRNPGRGAFRVARSVAAELLFADLVNGAENLYDEPVLASRPDDLYPFPGADKHCKCYLWPELKNRHPMPVTSVDGIVDPRL